MADDPNPSATSLEYDAQAAFWSKVDAILGGEKAIKAGGQTYLPKFEKERKETYEFRLKVSPFTNIYGDISKNLASKPFAKPVRMKDGTPSEYEKLAENIDGQSNNLHVFASQCFKAAMDRGVDWILVDHTRSPALNRAPTVAEARAMNLRPYWVRIPAKRMLAVYADFVNGMEVIYHARWCEDVMSVVDFKEVSIKRVRVMTRERVVDAAGNVVSFGPPMWELWEERRSADNKVRWERIEEGQLSPIDEIPLVPVTLLPRVPGSFICEAPLRDLADMQIVEYQHESDLTWARKSTCFPMVSISGMPKPVDKDGQPVEVVVGPNTVFMIPQNDAGTGPAGTVSYIEPGAQSIVENRQQLELLRKEMRDLGMQPLTQANLTVYTSANVSKKAASAAQAWVYIFSDALEKAWRLTARWLGDAAFEPEVIVNDDFEVEIDESKALSALLSARKDGIFSRQTVRAEFKRRGVVRNDLTDDEEEEQIAEEEGGLEPDMQIDPVRGQALDQSGQQDPPDPEDSNEPGDAGSDD